MYVCIYTHLPKYLFSITIRLSQTHRSFIQFVATKKKRQEHDVSKPTINGPQPPSHSLRHHLPAFEIAV